MVSFGPPRRPAPSLASTINQAVSPADAAALQLPTLHHAALPTHVLRPPGPAEPCWLGQAPATHRAYRASTIPAL
eukprot:5153237-Heterocapsa_arctica.AAC.1